MLKQAWNSVRGVARGLLRRRRRRRDLPSWLDADDGNDRRAEAPPINDIAELRRYADSLVTKLPLLSLPRDEALRHAFRTLQTGWSLNVVANPGYDAVYGGARASQDLLRYLTFKVFERCPAGGRDAETGPEEAKAASNALDFFTRFSVIHDGILAVEKGYMSIEFESPGKRISFYYDKEQAEAKLGLSIADQERNRRTKFRDNSSIGEPLPKLRSPLEHFFSGITFDAGTLLFNCSISDELLQLFIEHVGEAVGPAGFPRSLSLGGYTFGEFHDFWMVLKSYSELHHLALMKVLADPRVLPTLQNGPVANSPFFLSEAFFCELLRRNTDVGGDPARQIIRDLTYDPHQVKWVDIMHQPLVPLAETHRACMPVVVSHSNFERNLLALVDRLPWRADGSITLKDAREELMISELSPRFQKQGLHVRGRLPLRAGGRALGDVDLLVWDKEGTNVLLISLKWFYGPDSVQEVWQHDEFYREALAKHQEHIGFFRDNLTELSGRFDLSLRSDTELFGAVVSKHDLPTGYVERAQIPVVTQTQCEECISKCGGSIESLHGHLKRLCGHALPKPEVRESTYEIEFGGYRVKLPAVEYHDPKAG